MDGKNDPLVRAQIFEDQGQLILAAEAYEQALDLGIGDQAFIHQKRGRVLARLGYLEEAIEECQKALELRNDMFLAYELLGYLHNLQGKYDIAEKELLKALSLKPDDKIVLANLTSMYFAMEEYQKATETIEKYIQLRPDDLEAKFSLANLYIRQGLFYLAISLLSKMLKGNLTNLRLYLVCITLLVNTIGRYFNRLNMLARFSATLVIYLIASLTPSFVSVPIGILISVYGILTIIVLISDKQKGCLLSFLLIIFISSACTFYWFLVCWHHYSGGWGVPIIQPYFVESLYYLG